MGRPFGLLRAGFPFHKTLGMRRLTNFPIDLAIGQEDRLYILCRSEGTALIRRYSTEDKDLGNFGSYGSDPGQMTWPVTILADGDENLYLTDESLHRVTILDKEGELLDSWGEEGSGAGQLNGPTGMDFDAEGNLYVVDTLNHRVQKFTREGGFLGQWGSYGCGEGEFNMPWGIAVDEVGDVYVADWRNDRVQKFSADGGFLMAFGASGCGDGEFNRPSGVDVDLHGDIYVVDRGNNRVQLFNEEGRYVQQFVGRRHPLQGGHLLHADQRLPQPPARHGEAGDSEASALAAVRGCQRGRPHVRARHRLLPRPGLPKAVRRAERVTIRATAPRAGAEHIAVR